jgi:hypothetical protein
VASGVEKGILHRQAGELPPVLQIFGQQPATLSPQRCLDDEGVPVRETGLERASVANVSQLTVVDRGRLAERVGVLPARLLTQVEDGVRQVLSL